MTRIDSLKSKIADAKERMTTLNLAVETAKRNKTKEERQAFDTDLAEVQVLELELRDCEAIEKIRVEAPAVITSERKAKNRIYSASRGIVNFMNNDFSGLEGEVHQEARKTNVGATGFLVPDELIYRMEAGKRVNKRTETYANSGGLYSEIAESLDIVSQPSMYEVIGCTQYNNLSNVIKLNFAEGLDADSVAEGAALTGKSYTKVTDSLTPVAYGHMISVSSEALAVTDFVSEMFLDADSAIGAKVSKSLLAAILAVTGTSLTGYAVGATAVTLTSKMVNSLKAAVLSAIFRNPKYVLGGALYSELEETQAATVLRTIITDGKIQSWDAVNVMELLAVHSTNKYDLLFGDWARSFVARFGNSTEILVNPYSNQSTRQIVISFNRLQDWSFNPYVFKCIRNAKLA
jgi:HK97 family phage major capsid protein